MGNRPRRSEGHDLDLGQHVLQAGRADGTATDGGDLLGETVTNVGRVWRYSRIVSFLRPRVHIYTFFFNVWGFAVRFRLDSVLRCMFIILLFSLTIQNCHVRMVNTVTMCRASEFSLTPGEPARLSMLCWDGSVFWPGRISHHRPLYDGCDLSQEDSMASGASLQDGVLLRMVEC